MLNGVLESIFIGVRFYLHFRYLKPLIHGLYVSNFHAGKIDTLTETNVAPENG